MYLKTSYLPWTRDISNLHALIICINEYNSDEFPPLHSAIRDGLRFKQYLTNRLTVPESQIHMLIGPEASRSGIIRAFQSLQSNVKIQIGDPIVIYYAGHGNEVSAPPSWPFYGQPWIQSIVPQNYCSIPGLEVPCIPDRTIGALLKAIARQKGNNITVVLDCCHAASSTRGKAGEQTRSGKKPIVIRTDDLDRDIWAPEDEIVYPSPEFCEDGLYSHTVIAACGPSERAIECGEYGRFSHAFIKLLNAIPPDEIQYSKILLLMDKIRGQNPQIEGVNLDRFLFNTAPQTHPPPVHHLLTYDPRSDMHFISLGTAHGVTDGALFDAKSDRSPNATNIGTLTVINAMAFCSSVKPSDDCPTFKLDKDPKSKVILVPKKAGARASQLLLYLSREHGGANYRATSECLQSLLKDVKYDLRSVVIVDDLRVAHLKVLKSGNKVAFQFLDRGFDGYIHSSRRPFDTFGATLEALSEFRWELDRTNEDKSGLMHDIDLSVYFIEETPITSETSIIVEMAPIDGKNLCESGELDLVVTRERHLGFSLTNTGTRALYPVLQYFDFRNLGKILTLYRPPISAPYRLEAPLKKNQSLTIGYGSGGMPPLSLTLLPSQDLVAGYLKLSVFTRPLDFGMPNARSKDTWGTYTVPVTLRRHPVETPGVHTPISSSWPNRNQKATAFFPKPMAIRSVSTPNPLLSPPI